MGSGSAGRRSGGDVAFLCAVIALGGAILAWLVIGLLPALVAHVSSVRSLVTGWAGGDDGFSELCRRVLTASRSADGAGRVTVDYLFSALNLALAALLVVRRPHDLLARLLTVAMIGTAATFNHQSHSLFTSDLLGPEGLHDVHDLIHVVSGIAYMDAVLLFPDKTLVPRVAGRRSAWVVCAAYVAAHLAVIVFSLGAISESHPGQVFFVRFFGLLIPIAGVAAQTYRLRQANSPEQAQQARLLRWALLPTFAAGLVFSTAARAQLESLGLVLFPALFALIPVALLVGILRYRLWDIDVLVNRALVYGALAGFIGIVYVAVVVTLGAALGTGDGPGAVASIAATALVAVAIEPVRERLVRLANRLVYGQRASPAELLTGFTDRLAESYATDDMLARLAQVVADGTGAVRATVWLATGGQLVPVAAFPGQDGAAAAVACPSPDEVRAGHLPQLPGSGRVVPVLRSGELLGVVAVTKAPGEAVRPTEDELLADVASQAGLVLHNVQLAADLSARLADLRAQAAELRESRQRIVAVQDAERRRLERDIHDGAQQHLVALAIQLEVAASAVGDEDASSIGAMFAELGQLTDEAVGTLRDLARGIYSSALSRDGLVGALEAHARRLPVPTIVVSEGVGRYPLEVETAAYFSCLEALQNVSKHASASKVVLHLEERDEHLCFSVDDDGVGFDPARSGRGSGLSNVAERMAALGGQVEVRSAAGAGTAVSGRLPVGT